MANNSQAVIPDNIIHVVGDIPGGKIQDNGGLGKDAEGALYVKTDGETIDINSDGELEVIGGGHEYTAGTGIDITNDEISVDTSVVATQTDLESYTPTANLSNVATSGSYTDLSNTPTIPSGAQLLPSATSADEGKFLLVDANGLPEWSDLSDGSSYSIANGSVVFTPGQYYTDGVVTLSNIRSNGIDYAYNHDGWVLERDHTYVIAFNIVASVGYAEPGNITGRVWLDGFQETDQVWKFSIDTSASHDESLVGSAIVCPQSTGEVHLNIRYDSNQLAHIPSASVNKAEIVDVTARVSGAGGATYSAGSGLNLTGTTFSVDTTTIATKSDLSAYTPTASLATVATTGNYSDLSGKPTIPSGAQLVPAATSADADKVLTVDSLGVPGWAVIPSQPTGLFEAVYGTTTFADISQAVTDKRIVYCKVDLGYGARMAFLAYVSDDNAEFQYYRSMSSHSASVQTDEVYIYKVTANGWTTTTRKTGVNVTAGTHMSQSYSNDTLTLNCTWPTVDQTYDSASTNAQSGTAVAGAILTKQDTISDLATIRSGAAAGATAVQPGDLATVATTGSYNDLSNKPTIPSTKPLVAGTNVTITENANDVTIAATDTTYSAGTGISISSGTISADTTILATKSELPAGVPAVTSSDDDKVLKASYSGGAGSYSWEPEPTMVGIVAGSNVTVTEGVSDITIAATDTTYTAGNMIAIDANNSNAIGVSTTAGITDIQVVNALPASPVATVLYIIPET